jgi:photosystem II stability/assembly factor-like uncharacterized protein
MFRAAKNRYVITYEKNSKFDENFGVNLMFAIRYLMCCIFAVIVSEPMTAQWSRLIDAPTYGFAVNPKNPNTIYVGGLGRKLYRTDNAGKTWDTLVVEFETGTSRFTNVVVSEADTSVVIVAGLGFGTVRRSNDRGNTWSTVIETLSPYFAPSESIYTVPDNPSTMIAGELTSRIIRKSLDNGLTWDSIGTVLPGTTYFLCTLTPRRDSTNIIYGGCTPSVIARSTDGGKSWTEIAQLSKNSFGDGEVPKIAISKRNPAIMYAVVTYFFPDSKPNGGVFQSTDYGFTWKRIGYQDTSLWAIDTRPFSDSDDEIWVGGLSDGFGGVDDIPGKGVLSRSVTTGKVWEQDTIIPWFTNKKQNVWILRFVKNSNGEEIVYYATEDGFLRYDYSLNSVQDEEWISDNETLRLGYRQKYLTIMADNLTENLVHVSIMNSIGEVVHTIENVSKEQLSEGIAMELSNGAYFVTITNRNGQYGYGKFLIVGQ